MLKKQKNQKKQKKQKTLFLFGHARTREISMSRNSLPIV